MNEYRICWFSRFGFPGKNIYVMFVFSIVSFILFYWKYLCSKYCTRLKSTHKTVVGKAYGRHLSEKTLKTWVDSSWGSTLNPPPKINHLSRGWFIIIFLEAAQTNRVIQKCWYIDSSLVILNPWDSTFDSTNESLDSVPIWVCLPELTPHTWFVKVFQDIGNMMGICMDVDMSFLESGEMVVEHILVSLKIHGGFRKYFTITNKGRSQVQIIDYEGVPFCCSHCHSHENIVKDYPLPF